MMISRPQIILFPGAIRIKILRFHLVDQMQRINYENTMELLKLLTWNSHIFSLYFKEHLLFVLFKIRRGSFFFLAD